MSVHKKLLEAQKAITAIGKTGHNDHFDYDFFEEREVLRVARGALNDAGLVFFYSVDDVSDREVTTSRGRAELLTDVRMTCTIYDSESGESVQGGAIGRGQDGQDKGVNKAIVAGLKYWLLKVLMIPTDDDTERNENTNAGGNVSASAELVAEVQALWIKAASLGVDDTHADGMARCEQAVKTQSKSHLEASKKWLEARINEAKEKAA